MCVCVCVKIHKITKRSNLKATKERHKGMFRGKNGGNDVNYSFKTKREKKTRER